MRDDSNGEVRFVIRDLENFWVLTEITILPFFRKFEFSWVLQLAKRNFRAPSEASGSSSRYRIGGVIELNKMIAIEAKLDAIMTRMNNHKRISHLINEVQTVNGA